MYSFKNTHLILFKVLFLFRESLIKHFISGLCHSLTFRTTTNTNLQPFKHGQMQMRTRCSLTVAFLKDQGLPDTEAYQTTLLPSSRKQNTVICHKEDDNHYITSYESKTASSS